MALVVVSGTGLPTIVFLVDEVRTRVDGVVKIATYDHVGTPSIESSIFTVGFSRSSVFTSNDVLKEMLQRGLYIVIRS